MVEALRFVSWPGEQIIPGGLSWQAAQEIREKFFEKGRLESVDWEAVAERLNGADEFEIADASIVTGDSTILKFEPQNDDQIDFHELRITAKEIKFFLGLDRELSLLEFLEYGESYWQAFDDGHTTAL